MSDKIKVEKKSKHQRHNKQHHPRAASFLRVGKALKVRAANYQRRGQLQRADWLRDVAEELAFEGKFLRTLR